MSVPNTPRPAGAGRPRQSRPAASRSRRAPRRHTLLPFALCCVGALALGHPAGEAPQPKPRKADYILKL